MSVWAIRLRVGLGDPGKSFQLRIFCDLIKSAPLSQVQSQKQFRMVDLGAGMPWSSWLISGMAPLEFGLGFFPVSLLVEKDWNWKGWLVVLGCILPPWLWMKHPEPFPCQRTDLALQWPVVQKAGIFIFYFNGKAWGCEYALCSAIPQSTPGRENSLCL